LDLTAIEEENIVPPSAANNQEQVSFLKDPPSIYLILVCFLLFRGLCFDSGFAGLMHTKKYTYTYIGDWFVHYQSSRRAIYARGLGRRDGWDDYSNGENLGPSSQ